MNKDVIKIRNTVKEYVSNKRFKHTLGVEKEAVRLGEIFLPNKLEKLQIAGILHDITKDFNVEEQLSLCKKYGINFDCKSVQHKLLHSKTGCEFSKRLFGDVVDEEIYNGILYHTTGRENMSLFESIIYLADYIEETRTFPDCLKLRKYFYGRIELANSYEEKIMVLKDTMIFSFNLTIMGLLKENKVIDKDTIKARNYFISCSRVF